VTRYALDPLGRRLGAWSLSAGQVHRPFTAEDKHWQQAILKAGTEERSSLDGWMKAYAYDKVGELRQSRHSLNGDAAYRYDATGRIEQARKQAFGQAANSEHFQYDPAGNILDSATQAFIASRTRHTHIGYVRDNLVRVFEDKRYFYDGHGRLIRKLSGKHTDQRFIWDDENRLIEVVTIRRPGTEHQTTQSTKFDYDALGRRVAKHDSDLAPEIRIPC
jgi:YD repeat-containing protein